MSSPRATLAAAAHGEIAAAYTTAVIADADHA